MPWTTTDEFDVVPKTQRMSLASFPGHFIDLFSISYFHSAAHFGDGVYTSTSFSYSAQATYSLADASGLKHILVCRVLVGDHMTGAQDIKMAPSKNQNIWFNLVVDSVQAVVFILQCRMISCNCRNLRLQLLKNMINYLNLCKYKYIFIYGH